MNLFEADYDPNFEKVGSILLSACVSVRPFKKYIKARVLKFHRWIPRQKIANPYFFLSELSPLAQLCPF